MLNCPRLLEWRKNIGGYDVAGRSAAERCRPFAAWRQLSVALEHAAIGEGTEEGDGEHQHY